MSILFEKGLLLVIEYICYNIIPHSSSANEKLKKLKTIILLMKCSNNRK